MIILNKSVTLNQGLSQWIAIGDPQAYIFYITQSYIFPAQRPVTQSFGVFFDLRLNKRLSKQS